MTETSWVEASEQPRDDVPSAAPASAEESTDDAAGEPAAEPAIGALSLDPAHQGQIGGECGTTPEGATISVGGSTSCDFAAAVYPHAISAEYTWSNKPGLTSVPFTELYGVVSPATGGAYDLRCSVGSAGDTLSCSGPDNDPYVAYRLDHVSGDVGTWHPLINIVGEYPG